MSLTAPLHQVQAGMEQLQPFLNMEVKNGINPLVLNIFLRTIVPKGDLPFFNNLHATVQAVFSDLKKSEPGSITVGQLIGHPKVMEFIKTVDDTPVWKQMKCPRCRSIFERNLVKMTPCPCGYDWSEDKDQIQAAIAEERGPGLLDTFAALREQAKL